jgi:NADH pyrophosphatase NudC (nudix superfamily)
MKFCPICTTELIYAAVDGAQRLKCPSQGCGYVYWDNPIPVVVGIVELNNSVILVRNVGWPEKMFGLVTGFLEKEETPEESILREVEEELGIIAQISQFVGYYAYFDLNQLLLVFHLTAEGDIVLGSELEDFRVIPIRKLKPWDFGTGIALKEWLEARRGR